MNFNNKILACFADMLYYNKCKEEISMFEVREYAKNKKGKVLYETVNLWDALSVTFKYRKQGHDVVLTERKDKKCNK